MVKTVDWQTIAQGVADDLGIPAWSDAQKKIFEAIATHPGSITVVAAAGAGKTSTILCGASLIPEDSLATFMAFNRVIAHHAARIMPKHIEATTIHARAGKVLREHGIFFDRKEIMYKIMLGVEKVFSVQFLDWQERDNFVNSVRSVVDMARLTLTDVRDFDGMRLLAVERGTPWDADHTDVYIAVLEVLEWCSLHPRDRYNYQLSPLAVHISTALQSLSGRYGAYDATPKKATIDYTGMIEQALKVAEPTFDVIFFDEAQDSNNLFFELIMSLLKPGGRLIAVGDSKQNIMGWAGSFLTGLDTVIERTNALELPLDVSFRCPKSHIELTNEVFPNQTQPAPWAEEGIVQDLSLNEAYTKVADIYNRGENVVVMCRFNAPAITFAMKMLADYRIPAVVKGRDFCTSIQNLVKKIAGKRTKFGDFPTAVSRWYNKEFAILAAKNAGDTAFTSLADKRASINALYSGTAANDLEGFIAEIDSLFSDADDRVVCSSIHKMKGGESDNILILEYSVLPYYREGMTEGQIHGEKCVYYVVVTRSKKYLGRVASE